MISVINMPDIYAALYSCSCFHFIFGAADIRKSVTYSLLEYAFL